MHVPRAMLAAVGAGIAALVFGCSPRGSSGVALAPGNPDQPVYFERPVEYFLNRWGDPKHGRNARKEPFVWVAPGIVRTVAWRDERSDWLRFDAQFPWTEGLIVEALREYGSGWIEVPGEIVATRFPFRARCWTSREGTMAQLTTSVFSRSGRLLIVSRTCAAELLQAQTVKDVQTTQTRDVAPRF